jgi:hypothetical protein
MKKTKNRSKSGSVHYHSSEQLSLVKNNTISKYHTFALIFRRKWRSLAVGE